MHRLHWTDETDFPTRKHRRRLRQRILGQHRHGDSRDPSPPFDTSCVSIGYHINTGRLLPVSQALISVRPCYRCGKRVSLKTTAARKYNDAADQDVDPGIFIFIIRKREFERGTDVPKTKRPQRQRRHDGCRLAEKYPQAVDGRKYDVAYISSKEESFTQKRGGIRRYREDPRLLHVIATSPANCHADQVTIIKCEAHDSIKKSNLGQNA